MLQESGLRPIINAVRTYPHEFVEVIPFSYEIHTNTELVGTDYIPYGSTLFTNIACMKQLKGLHFDLDQFNYAAALSNRTDMLNQNVMVVTEAIEFLSHQPKESFWFARPSQDLKHFSGAVNTAIEWKDALTDMVACASSGSYRLDASTEVVVCPPQEIDCEWRWFIVGGKIVTGSIYRIHNQLRSIEELDQTVIDEAQELANGWLPDSCCVMDVALVGDTVKIIEFNCINSSGFYACNVDKIFAALWEFHNKGE